MTNLVRIAQRIVENSTTIASAPDYVMVRRELIRELREALNQEATRSNDVDERRGVNRLADVHTDK